MHVRRRVSTRACEGVRACACVRERLHVCMYACRCAYVREAANVYVCQLCVCLEYRQGQHMIMLNRLGIGAVRYRSSM